MKKLLVALVLTALSAGAQEAQKKSEGDAMMEYYIEQAKPVKEHERLAALAGPWKVTSTMWFGDQAMASTGKGSGKMILGGRFLQLDAAMTGELSAEFLTLMGYDRRTGEYTMIGLDTVGTYYITAAGKYDEAKKAVVLHGSYMQPPTNQEQKYYFVWTNPGPREHLMTLYFTMGGTDVRVAETRYTRD
jgi:Protein of unknown function (DUF1579)